MLTEALDQPFIRAARERDNERSKIVCGSLAKHFDEIDRLLGLVQKRGRDMRKMEPGYLALLATMLCLMMGFGGWIWSLGTTTAEAQDAPIGNWFIYEATSSGTQNLFAGGPPLFMYDNHTGTLFRVSNRCGQDNPSPCLVYVPPAQ